MNEKDRKALKHIATLTREMADIYDALAETDDEDKLEELIVKLTVKAMKIQNAGIDLKFGADLL